MDLICEEIACDVTYEIVAACGVMLCLRHAFMHHFCTDDVGGSGCVVANFRDAGREIPHALVNPNMPKVEEKVL